MAGASVVVVVVRRAARGPGPSRSTPIGEWASAVSAKTRQQKHEGQSEDRAAWTPKPPSPASSQSGQRRTEKSASSRRRQRHVGAIVDPRRLPRMAAIVVALPATDRYEEPADAASTPARL
jgi:hypothetical protein